MFEMFTDRARRVIVYAKEEAEKLMRPEIDTEHLLLGLLREKTGAAAEIFAKHDIKPSQVAMDIHAENDQGNMFIFKGSLPFSAAAQKVLSYAVEESRSFEHKYVNTEHLLLGLVREKRGKASSILSRLGLDIASLREDVAAVSSNFRQATDGQSETPTLDEFARDLTAMAKQGKLDRIVGRNVEIERLVQILSRRQKNNAILLGEAGVGKTAIVEGLATRMLEEGMPDFLRKKRLVSLEVGSLVAGTKYRGQFEERMKNLLKEIENEKNIIVFIDEIHTIVGAGAAEGSIDAANMLKPALARGRIQCIGATTLSEYRKQIEKDGALERRFQTILVRQPDEQQTVSIIKGVKKYYENFHKVFIPDNVAEEAVFLSDRYITDKYQPDKSIDIIDEACAKRKLSRTALPENIKKIQDKLFSVRAKREKFMNENTEEQTESFAHDIGGGSKLGQYNQIEKYTRELNNLGELYQTKVADWNEEVNSNWPALTVEDVSEVVSMVTGIPTQKLKLEDRARVASIDKDMKKFLIGQDEAIDNLSKAIKRNFAGLSNPARPMGSFIFLGPTGVGKTEAAKRLAELVFGTSEALIRIDMSEFMEKFNVSRLVGAPPGYVGYEEGGKLTEQVRRRPYSVVLFDEVEKAHPEVMNILLQILDEGFITDSLGHKVNFKNTIVILTSNIGTKRGADDKILGFGGVTNGIGRPIDHVTFKSAAERELKERFAPEFLNRLDNVIYFKPLGIKELEIIIDLQVEEINKRMEKIGKKIHIDKATKDFLLSGNYPFMYGARPIKRLLQSHIEDRLSDILITDKWPNRRKFKTTVINNEVVIK